MTTSRCICECNYSSCAYSRLNTYPLVWIEINHCYNHKVNVDNRLEEKQRQTQMPVELVGRTRLARFPGESNRDSTLTYIEPYAGVTFVKPLLDLKHMLE